MTCVNGSGSQLSPLIRTFSPLPIRHVEPQRTRLLAFKMLCQAYELLVLTPPSNIEQLGKCLALKIIKEKRVFNQLFKFKFL